MSQTPPCAGGRLIEQVCSFNLPRRLTEGLLTEGEDGLPSAIYPEIRVLTAEKITKNKTFYPTESLKKGLGSFVRPYPIPVIKDHDTWDASNTYGRVYKRPQLVTEGNATFIKAVAAITHPEAIEAVLSGRWLTVSLGSKTETVTCSICDTDLTQAWCDHMRGETYEVDKKKRMAYWIIGPLEARELSFVLTPSDDEAGVLNQDTSLDKKGKEAADGAQDAGLGVQECAAGSVTRVIIGGKQGLFDLVTGNLVQESFMPSSLPAHRGNFHFLGY